MRVFFLSDYCINTFLYQIPKPRPPTMWELFAKQKGIRKEKRSRMVFDEQAQVSPHPFIFAMGYSCCVGVEAAVGIQ